MTDRTPIHPDMLPPETRWLADRYEFLSELGRGGMSVVYLARERDSGRQVAIKLVSGRYAGDADAIRRFARAARTVVGLHHPNIVRTLGIEERDGAVAIVHAYVHGETLRSVLARSGALAFDEAASILRDVAAALAHAHRQRIVHRDVKPENVFLLDGSRKALLADFGIARSLDVDSLLTAAGASLGTPAYMSPEQVDGGPVDERTDVYALGLVGWEMLAGRRPWYGETLYAMLYKQKHEALPSLAALRPDIPAFLLAAIEGALAKEPAARWRDAGELLERLTPRAATLPPVAARDAEEEGASTVQLLAGPVAAGTDVVPTGSTAVEPVPPVGSAPVDVVDRSPAPGRRAGPRRRRWPIVAGAAGVAALAALLVATGRANDGPAPAGSPALDSLRTAASGAPATAPVTAQAPARAGDTAAARPPATPPAAAAERGRVTEAAGEVRLPARRPTSAVSAPSRVGGASGAPRPGAPRPVARAANPASVDPRCASPATADQQACLMAHIDEEDVPLNRTYGALIAAVRRRRGESAVHALRVQQRAWLVERDRVCRARHPAGGGADALWGLARAPCFAELSARREAELARRLRAARGG